MNKTQRLTRLALFSAVAYVVMLIGRVPVFQFLSYDPKDVIITIAGFAFGPLSAAAITFVVSLIEMLLASNTGIIGFFMNVVSSCGFACVAAFIYKKKHNLQGAVAGLVLGTVTMTVLMLLWNYIVTPFYLGVPREEVVAMLMPVFLPFNLLKASINSGLVLILYKPIRRVFSGIGLIPNVTQNSSSGKMITVISMAAFFLIAIVIALMAF